MELSELYLLAADAILAAHVFFVAFVVFGLLLILIGKLRAWHWVRNPWFRLAHLAAIAVVVLQSWFSVICPLTIWEMALRERAGGAVYSGSFIAHWLETFCITGRRSGCLWPAIRCLEHLWWSVGSGCDRGRLAGVEFTLSETGRETMAFWTRI